MIAIFDEDGGGDVDFQEFVSGLSAFSSKGNKEQKLRFAFKVYDIDRDGYISNGELFIVLKMMVGSNLKDQQLQQIVDKTIMEADLDRDGKISFEEFTKMVENTDVSMSMTLGKSLSSFLSISLPLSCSHLGTSNALTPPLQEPWLMSCDDAMLQINSDGTNFRGSFLAESTRLLVRPCKTCCLTVQETNRLITSMTSRNCSFFHYNLHSKA